MDDDSIYPTGNSMHKHVTLLDMTCIGKLLNKYYI